MIAQRFFSLAIIVAVAAVVNADPRLRATADLVNTEEVSESLLQQNFLHDILILLRDYFSLLSHALVCLVVIRSFADE